MSRFGGPRVEAALRDPSYLTVANIIGIRNFNSNNDVDAVEDYLARNGDPYQNQLDAANQALRDQQNRFVQQLEEITLGDSSIPDFPLIKEGFMRKRDGVIYKQVGGRYVITDEQGNEIPEPPDPVEALTLQLQQSQQQNNAFLERQLSQQQAQFDQQMVFQQQQAARAEALAAEQARIAENQANAFVPAPNPSAQSVAAGDDREDVLGTPTKRKKQTEVDDLSIVSGIGSQGNPLAGLQIA